MAYVPANNVLQVELRGLLNAEPVENTLAFRRGDTIEPAEVEALFDWLEDVFLPQYAGNVGTIMGWDEIYGTDLTTSISPTYTRVISPFIPGERPDATLPGSDSCCLSFRTANRGRSARGRNYVTGLTEGQVTGNSVLLSEINAFVALYELLLGGGTFPAGWEWVVVSRILDGLPRAAAFVQEITNVISTDVVVDSQRGRLR